jgi:hypothetical protein
LNLHETITRDLQEVIDRLGGADTMSPTYLADTLLADYGGEDTDPRLRYTGREHLKQMARKVLAGRYGHEGDDNEAHQGELFSGHLQPRYPIPRAAGEEPVYKLLGALTPEELAWNVRSLRASAKARLLHADALEAWAQSHRDAE